VAGPNDTDELDDLNEEESEEEEHTENDSDSDSDEEDSATKDSEDKRIRDLQSKADKAEARANKAEAALAAKAKVRDGDGAGLDPTQQALITELREAGLDAIFGEYPELKEYGIDRSLIEGTTRAEMRVGATSLVSLIKKVSTRAANKALEERGLTAAPAGTTRSKPVNYETMSEEEFKKVLDSVY